MYDYVSNKQLFLKYWKRALVCVVESLKNLSQKSAQVEKKARKHKAC